MLCLAAKVRPGVSLAVFPSVLTSRIESSRRDEWSILFLGQHLGLFPAVWRFTSVHQKSIVADEERREAIL